MSDAPSPRTVATAVDAARLRIAHLVRATPLLRASWLDGPACSVYLKLESLQHTGSFKVRGAFNFLLAQEGVSDAEIVTASSGNHGVAVAFACSQLGRRCVVIVPQGASSAKTSAMQRFGAQVKTVGADCVDSETAARDLAAQRGGLFVSPYNDPLVIAGQGTIAPELTDSLDEIDAIIASVGGGGLVTGIASWLKNRYPPVTVVGASPENSCVMAESVRLGRIVDMQSTATLSDGTAGGVETDAITYPLCAELVDAFELVSETEIASAMVSTLTRARVLAEGAACCAVAAYLRRRESLVGNVVIVICGGNVSIETLRSVVCT